MSPSPEINVCRAEKRSAFRLVANDFWWITPGFCRGHPPYGFDRILVDHLAEAAVILSLGSHCAGILLLLERTMDRLRAAIAEKKVQLDRLRGLAPGALANPEHAHDIELTHTSNAIEGNTLSAAETTLVVERGITIGGKPLKDHLEALDHYDALRYVRELARDAAPLTEGDIRNLHRLVMRRSDPRIAGRYADQGRFVVTDTGRHAFPWPAEVPALMRDLAQWLTTAATTPETAFAAHRRLVAIHPFNDGNGRTARLLMNLVLLRGGYPPVAVRPDDRLAYLAALQDAQSGGGSERFDRLLCERLDATLDDYVCAARAALAVREPSPKEET
jgi:Fic family protein